MPARRAVAALAVTTTAGYGVLFYAYGVLLVPMEEDLGWSRSFLTGAFSTALVVSAVGGVAVGRWLDRHPPRPLFLTGASAAALLVAAWSAVQDRVPFFAVWVLLGGCQAILFYEPAFTVLTKWLDGHARYRAVTAVTLLAGLASTVFGPLTAVLERALGWRGAVLVLGGILAAVTLPAFALGLRAPAGVDGIGTHGTDRGGDRPGHVVPRDAFVSVRFWYLTVAYLLNAVTTFAVAVHLVPYLLGRGFDSGAAAAALGAVGLVQVLGRSTFARLSVHRSPVVLGTWVLAVKAVGLALLLVVPGGAGVVAFVVVYGATNGLATLTRATAVAELYGARHYGAISSVIAAVGSVAGAVAPFAFAVAVDLTGDDDLVLWGLVGVSVLAAFASARVAGATRTLGRGVSLERAAPDV